MEQLNLAQLATKHFEVLEAMVKIIDESMAAHIGDDFVAFLIGMRINRLWRITKWLPAFLAMPRMIKELENLPPEETAFLGHNGVDFTTVQYWRSFDHLAAYARSQENKHFPAWTAFNKRMKNARGDVGVEHET